MGKDFSSKPRPIYIANQGGGALNAVAWGALVSILENPFYEIIGATGTSSGALNAAALMEGLTLDGREGAIRRLNEIWQALSHYQNHQIPLQIHLMDTSHQLCSAIPILQIFSDESRKLLDYAASFNSQPFFRTSPMLSFLKMMDAKGRGLDFDALRRLDDDKLIINAAVIRDARNPWHAQAGDERIFTGKDVTAEAIAASGNLMEFSPPLMIKGELLGDGAYFSNPHLQRAAAFCATHNADLVVLYTRPAGCLPFAKGKEPATNQQKRAFFNAMLDEQIIEIRRDYPDLKIHIIAPKTLEKDGAHLFKPELCFHQADIQRRYQEGYAAAARILTPPAPLRAETRYRPVAKLDRKAAA